MSVTVRRATSPADLDDARRLIRGLLEWQRQRPPEVQELVEAYFDLDAFEAELSGLPGGYSRPEGELLLAEIDGRVVGSHRFDADTCEMARPRADRVVSMSDPMTPPPAWYPDAEYPGGERWWDGLAWTEYRRAAPQPAMSAPTGYPGYVAPQQVASFAPAEVPLWAPLYGAGFGQAVRRFWKKSLDFSGRASRSEFWFAYLAYFLILFGSYLVIAIVAGVASTIVVDTDAVGIMFGVLGLLWLVALLAMMVPYIAVVIRRLHDANYPGTYYLFAFIPFVGGILLLVFLAMESNPQGARFDLPRD